MYLGDNILARNALTKNSDAMELPRLARTTIDMRPSAVSSADDSGRFSCPFKKQVIGRKWIGCCPAWAPVSNGTSHEATDKNGRLLEAGMVEHIEMEGRGGWPALKPETVKRKAKMGREKMLQLTGQLIGAIRYSRRRMG